MAKNKKNVPVRKEPPLHVELSPAAAAALLSLRLRGNWNKKTAVEVALIEFSKGLVL